MLTGIRHTRPRYEALSHVILMHVIDDSSAHGEDYGDFQRRMAAWHAESADVIDTGLREVREAAAREPKAAQAPELDALFANIERARQRMKLLGSLSAADAVAWDRMREAGGPENPQAWADFVAASEFHRALAADAPPNPKTPSWTDSRSTSMPGLGDVGRHDDRPWRSMAGCDAVTQGCEGGAVAGGFECSLLELDLIGEALGIDVRPFPFEVPVHGEQFEDRQRLASVAHESLSSKGLIDGPSFTPDVEQLMGLFGRGRLSIAMLGSSGQHSHRACAVLDGHAAVVAAQHGELVRFTPVNPTSVVRTVVDLLPPMRPGPGGSVMVTAPDQTRVRPDRRADEDFSTRSYLEVSRPPVDSAGAQRAVAEQILSRPRLGSGYVIVTSRDRNGREDGEPSTVSWVDTDVGRYLVVPSTGPDGRLHVTYTPGDLQRLEQVVARMVPAPV